MQELTPEEQKELEEISARPDGQEKDDAVQLFFMARQDKLGKIFIEETEKYRKELEELVSDIED